MCSPQIDTSLQSSGSRGPPPFSKHPFSDIPHNHSHSGYDRKVDIELLLPIQVLEVTFHKAIGGRSASVGEAGYKKV
jgi:hypothetical protein